MSFLTALYKIFKLRIFNIIYARIFTGKNIYIYLQDVKVSHRNPSRDNVFKRPQGLENVDISSMYSIHWIPRQWKDDYHTMCRPISPYN